MAMAEPAKAGLGLIDLLLCLFLDRRLLDRRLATCRRCRRGVAIQDASVEAERIPWASLIRPPFAFAPRHLVPTRCEPEREPLPNIELKSDRQRQGLSAMRCGRRRIIEGDLAGGETHH